jgi:hypothetical protein
MFYQDLDSYEKDQERRDSGYEESSVPVYSDGGDNYYAPRRDDSSYSLARPSNSNTETELYKYFLSRGMRREQAVASTRKVLKAMGGQQEKSAALSDDISTSALPALAGAGLGYGVAGGSPRRRLLGAALGALSGGLMPHSNAAGLALAGGGLGAAYVSQAGRMRRFLNNEKIKMLQDRFGNAMRRTPLEPRSNMRQALVGSADAVFPNQQAAVAALDDGLRFFDPNTNPTGLISGTDLANYATKKPGFMTKYLPEQLGGLGAGPINRFLGTSGIVTRTADDAVRNLANVDPAEIEALRRARQVLDQVDPATGIAQNSALQSLSRLAPTSTAPITNILDQPGIQSGISTLQTNLGQLDNLFPGQQLTDDFANQVRKINQSVGDFGAGYANDLAAADANLAAKQQQVFNRFKETRRASQANRSILQDQITAAERQGLLKGTDLADDMAELERQLQFDTAMGQNLSDEALASFQANKKSLQTRRQNLDEAISAMQNRQDEGGVLAAELNQRKVQDLRSELNNLIANKQPIASPGNIPSQEQVANFDFQVNQKLQQLADLTGQPNNAYGFNPIQPRQIAGLDPAVVQNLRNPESVQQVQRVISEMGDAANLKSLESTRAAVQNQLTELKRSFNAKNQFTGAQGLNVQQNAESLQRAQNRINNMQRAIYRSGQSSKDKLAPLQAKLTEMSEALEAARAGTGADLAEARRVRDAAIAKINRNANSKLRSFQEQASGIPDLANRTFDGYLQRAEAMRNFNVGLADEAVAAAGEADKAQAHLMLPAAAAGVGAMFGLANDLKKEGSYSWFDSSNWSTKNNTNNPQISETEAAFSGTNLLGDLKQHMEENYPYYMVGGAVAAPYLYMLKNQPSMEDMRTRGRI